MIFYSGFSLNNDKSLFNAFIKDTEYTMSGFSYGAIKAFKEALKSKTRIDTLQLFSPAFFQDKDDKYKRMQTMYFKKDANAYLEKFQKAVFFPSCMPDDIDVKMGKVEELDELLNFVWKNEDLKALQDKGIKIEVYLGSMDKIINSQNAKEFFLPYATTYMINKAGHALSVNTL